MSRESEIQAVREFKAADSIESSISALERLIAEVGADLPEPIGWLRFELWLRGLWWRFPI